MTAGENWLEPDGLVNTPSVSSFSQRVTVIRSDVIAGDEQQIIGSWHTRLAFVCASVAFRGYPCYEPVIGWGDTTRMAVFAIKSAGLAGGHPVRGLGRFIQFPEVPLPLSVSP